MEWTGRRSGPALPLISNSGLNASSFPQDCFLTVMPASTVSSILSFASSILAACLDFSPCLLLPSSLFLRWLLVALAFIDVMTPCELTVMPRKILAVWMAMDVSSLGGVLGRRDGGPDVAGAAPQSASPDPLPRPRAWLSSSAMCFPSS